MPHVDPVATCQCQQGEFDVHILTPWQHVAVAGVIMVGLTCIGWFDVDPIATFHFISGSVRLAPHVDPIAAFSWSV